MVVAGLVAYEMLNLAGDHPFDLNDVLATLALAKPVRCLEIRDTANIAVAPLGRRSWRAAVGAVGLAPEIGALRHAVPHAARGRLGDTLGTDLHITATRRRGRR